MLLKCPCCLKTYDSLCHSHTSSWPIPETTTLTLGVLCCLQSKIYKTNTTSYLSTQSRSSLQSCLYSLRWFSGLKYWKEKHSNSIIQMGKQCFLKSTLINKKFTSLSPEGVNKVKLWKFVQVEDAWGETCDQDVCRLVVGGGRQVVKIPVFVEEVPASAEWINKAELQRCFQP